MSTIVKALYGSRQIFKRIEAYLTYRLCSSLVFGMCFSLIYTASEYSFPTWPLILMSILNDFAVSASSSDRVVIQREPVVLNLYKVGTTSVVMAFISTLQVWALVQSLLDYNESSHESHFWGLQPQRARGFTGCEIAAFTFLSLIITVQLNLLVARSPKPFFLLKTEKDDAGYFAAVPPPSRLVLGAIAISLSAATLVVVFFDDKVGIGSGYGMDSIGWRNAGLVWSWALLWFIVIDLAKYAVLLIWKVAEKDQDGHTFFRNVLELAGDDDDVAGVKRIASLRQSFRKYETNVSPVQVGPVTSSSHRFDQGLTTALALMTNGSNGDGSNADFVSAQDFILAVETLQNDANLSRIVSRLFFEMAQMQARLDDLEG